MNIAGTSKPVCWVISWKQVGLDVIGSSLTEINVTSPTCFQEITDQTGFDVAAMYLTALEAQLQPKQKATP